MPHSTPRAHRTVRATIALIAVGATAALVVNSGTAEVASAANTTANHVEEFSSWPGNAVTNGRTKINGDWTGSGGNLLQRRNVTISGGAARLTSRANTKQGAEVMSDPRRTHGVGYYEASLKMGNTPGVVNGIFFISQGYTAPEVDLEVRSRDNGTGRTHLAFLTVRQADGSTRYQQVKLGFDPAKGYHTYGIGLGTTSVTFHADGKQLAHWTDLKPNLGSPTPLKGYLMSNTWAEGSAWMGALPTRDTSVWISWMRIWDGSATPRYTRP